MRGFLRESEFFLARGGRADLMQLRARWRRIAFQAVDISYSFVDAPGRLCARLARCERTNRHLNTAGGFATELSYLQFPVSLHSLAQSINHRLDAGAPGSHITDTNTPTESRDWWALWSQALTLHFSSRCERGTTIACD